MAKLLCQLHWDDKAKKVVKTYQVLSTGPRDSVRFVTRDTQPFIIKTNDEKLAKQLGLEKALNAKGKDLYEVKKATAKKIAPQSQNDTAQVRMGPIQESTKPDDLPPWLNLKCGGLDENRKFESWGGVGPDGFY